MTNHYPLHNRLVKKAKKTLYKLSLKPWHPRQRNTCRAWVGSRHGHLREQMEKIIELAKQYDSTIVSNAMERSLSFGAFGYGILKRIIDRQSKATRQLTRTPKQR